MLKKENGGLVPVLLMVVTRGDNHYLQASDTKAAAMQNIM